MFISTLCGSPALWEGRWQSAGPTSGWRAFGRLQTPEPAEWPPPGSRPDQSNASEPQHKLHQNHVHLEHCTAFGLNLYLYPSPPVSSFSSCGHHISILFSELCCHQNNRTFTSSEKWRPIVQNMYKTMWFFLNNKHSCVFYYIFSLRYINYVILSHASLNTQGSL